MQRLFRSEKRKAQSKEGLGFGGVIHTAKATELNRKYIITDEQLRVDLRTRTAQRQDANVLHTLSNRTAPVVE